MKIVVGYDGTHPSMHVLDDLMLAGLPPDTRALVVTIADPLDDSVDYHNPFTEEELTPIVSALPHSRRRLSVNAAEEISRKGAELLAGRFPTWEIQADPFAADPVEGLKTAADQFAADLIVVGSHSRSALGRLVPGSVSRGVVNEASCSVRIARRSVSRPGAPLRLVVAIDGGPDSIAAVTAVAQRTWPSFTSALLVTALPPRGMAPDDGLPSWIAPDNPTVRVRASETEVKAVESLRAAGLLFELRARRKVPVELILQTAHEWGADAIFLGARGHGSLERLLLGSVSASVAARAHCSVEIVRGV